MTIWILGAAGALTALGGFALGFFVGVRTAAERSASPRVEPPEEKRDGTQELLEQQKAFELLMKYSADDAYGMKGADE